MKRLLLFIWVCIISYPIAFPQITFIKDPNPNPTTQAGFPFDFASWNGHVYFTATADYIQGLWRTDGTEAGTELIKNHLNAHNYTPLGNKLLFRATGNEAGAELWVSDGSTNGTHMLMDIYQGEKSSRPANFTPFKGKLLFTAEDDSLGNELWFTDGSVAGTQILKDIVPGKTSSWISFIMPGDSLAYFARRNGAQSFDLGRTDGTPGNTEFFFSISTPGSHSFSDETSILIDNELYFFGVRDSLYGLWKSDGTLAGTRLLVSLPQRGQSPKMVYLNGYIYMLTGSPSSQNGSALFKSDGTQWNLQLVKDFQSLPLYFLSASQDKLFLTGRKQHWVSDGTTAGTQVLFQDANGNHTISKWVANGQEAFTIHSNELLYTQGSPASTKLLSQNPDTDNHSPHLGHLIPPESAFLNGKIIFSATRFSHENDYELWKSDGTAIGTQRIKDLLSIPVSSIINKFFIANNHFYFQALDTLGVELWRSDGTPNGTQRLADIFPGPDPSYPNQLEEMNGTIYFSATSPDTNGLFLTQMWAVDGINASIKKVSDAPLAPYNLPTSFSEKKAFKGKLYFAGGTPDKGAIDVELWSSDGSANGTSQLKEINPDLVSIANPQDSDPEWFIELNGKLYFKARTRVLGDEWWVTDGTSNGTSLLKEIYSGPQSGLYGGISPMKIGNYIFFIGIDEIHGMELWRTNGTAGGTQLYKETQVGQNGTIINLYTELNGELLYSTKIAGISKLWITNQPIMGTVMLDTVAPFLPISTISNCEACVPTVNNVALIPSSESFYEKTQLWRTDGTPLGTWQIDTDFSGGPVELLRNFVSHKGKLYFIANDSLGFSHIYQTDGFYHISLADGSQQGDPIINPRMLFSFKDKMYLIGDHPDFGQSLYQYTPTGQQNTSNSPLDPDHIKLQIFPNPAQSHIDIQVDHAETGELKIEIINMKGQKISESVFSKNSPDFQHRLYTKSWGSGLFLINIQLNGKKIVRKIIIE